MRRHAPYYPSWNLGSVRVPLGHIMSPICGLVLSYRVGADTLQSGLPPLLGRACYAAGLACAINVLYRFNCLKVQVAKNTFQ